MKRRIILFGGTFDPVHHGHITVARSAVEQLDADELIFIPASRSPHKHSHSQVPDSARMEMLMLATAGKNKFSVSDWELKRPSPSYSCDTVDYFSRQYAGDTRIYWLIGADMIDGLPLWHKIGRIVELCDLCIMTRPGHQNSDFSSLEGILTPAQIQHINDSTITVPSVDISSSSIRKLLASGGDISEMVHPKVLDYIIKNRFYA